MTIRNPLVLGGSLGITQLQSTDTLYNVYQPCWYGDGYDGNLTANSAISLSRDMYYNTLTPVSGCAINTKNFRIFCNTLDLSNAPTGAFITTASIFGGGNASGSTAGAGAYFLNGGASGTAGQTSAGNNTAGTAGATGNSGTPSGAYGSNMIINATGTGQTSKGGNGSTGTAGSGTAYSTIYNPVRFVEEFFVNNRTSRLSWSMCGFGGSGGAGDGTNAGGGGGGGPSACPPIIIFANTIITTASTAAGVISNKGGNGGNGANGVGGNAGGGAGGTGAQGGGVLIVYNLRTGPTIGNLVDVTGGSGGIGGNGVGTGLGGAGGGYGAPGQLMTYNTATGLWTISTAGAFCTGMTQPSTSTGGSGGTPVTTQLSF